MGNKTYAKNLNIKSNDINYPQLINSSKDNIEKYSALKEDEFHELFQHHKHADIEERIILTVLKEIQEGKDAELYKPSKYDEDFKVHIMVGLPRSGKSTIVKDLDIPVMNPDTIRLVYHGQRFFAPAEPKIWEAAQRIVDRFRTIGISDIVIDATNTNAGRRNMWKMYNNEFHVLRTPIEECINRAIKTNQEDLIPVIKNMAAKWDYDDTYKDI